jgi:hypothetical protein
LVCIEFERLKIQQKSRNNSATVYEDTSAKVTRGFIEWIDFSTKDAHMMPVKWRGCVGDVAHLGFLSVQLHELSTQIMNPVDQARRFRVNAASETTAELPQCM